MSSLKLSQRKRKTLKYRHVDRHSGHAAAGPTVLALGRDRLGQLGELAHAHRVLGGHSQPIGHALQQVADRDVKAWRLVDAREVSSP